jgi:hypothetical protein
MTKKPPTVTLWYFEFCTNGLGVWDRMWAASRSELAKERQWLKDINSKLDDKMTPGDELDGSQGQHGPARSVKVELTAEGVLHFAQNFAVDQGSC